MQGGTEPEGVARKDRAASAGDRSFIRRARQTGRAERNRRMRRIDELHLELAFAGTRMLRDLLVQEGIRIGRKAVGTLMRIMGIEAIFRRKNTSKPHPDHKVFPLSAAQARDRSSQSDLGRRYRLHPDGARLCVAGSDHRLVQPQSPRLAALQQHGGGLLGGGTGGSACEVRSP